MAGQQLLILFINIVILWCYPWESRMYSNNYQPSFEQRGQMVTIAYTCTHQWHHARMLTFHVTAIIYYIIINLAYAFIKSTNMILYHNCVYQGAVYNINKTCQGHTLIPKPLKCLFLYQLKFAIATNTVSKIYRNINKFLPNTIIYFTR